MIYNVHFCKYISIIMNNVNNLIGYNSVFMFFLISLSLSSLSPKTPYYPPWRFFFSFSFSFLLLSLCKFRSVCLSKLQFGFIENYSRHIYTRRRIYFSVQFSVLVQKFCVKNDVKINNIVYYRYTKIKIIIFVCKKMKQK